MNLGGSILVAEDSRLLLELLRDALLAHGIGQHVVACGTGEVLLERAQEALAAGDTPALYILDIVMPGASGLEVARSLRAAERSLGARTTPILLYSSLQRSPEIDEVIESCWPVRFCHKQDGARSDRLALAIVETLRELA
ncbi:MAG: response regulator [Pseudomonadota bacterium]